MKKFTRILSVVLCVVMLGSTVGLLAACKPDPAPSKPKYTITWRWGNDGIDTQKVDPGTPIVERAAPSLGASQKFLHWWYRNETEKFDFTGLKAYSNMTFVALICDANADLAEITYIQDEGIIDSVLPLDVTLPVDATLARPNAFRPYYVLNGWMLANGTSVIFPYTVTGSVSLKANWVEAWHVSLNLGGGTIVDDAVYSGDTLPFMQVAKGEKVQEPATPIRSGYSFDGWYLSPNPESTPGAGEYDFKTTSVTENITLYAKWKGGEGTKAPLVTNIGDPDEKFTPFFNTSAYDGSVVAQTQISMLTNNGSRPYAGDDVPTVAYDYTYETTFKGQPDPDGKKGTAAGGVKSNPDTFFTTYKFVIKKGIKFSTGEELTIKDVLFNMYVYLDPTYNGSSTMYSTNIVGLNAYRWDDDTLAVGGVSETQTMARQDARDRYDRIGQYYKTDENERIETRKRDFRDYSGTEEQKKAMRRKELQVLKDVKWLREQYYAELKADWNSIPDDPDAIYESYTDYGFKEKWQVFLLMQGLVTVKYNTNGTVANKVPAELDEDGKPVKDIDFRGAQNWFHDERLVDCVFDSTVGIYGQDNPNNYNANVGDPAREIKLDFNPAALNIDETYEFPLLGWKSEGVPYTDEDFINGVVGLFNPNGTAAWPSNVSQSLAARFVDDVNLATYYGGTLSGNMRMLLRYTATGSSAIESFTSQEISRIMDEKKAQGGGWTVPTISGITVEKATTFKGMSRPNAGTVTLNGEHDVLVIKIHGVDPKAIWNFGFTVAPMRYYSSPEGKVAGDVNQWSSAINGWAAFKYPGVNITEAEKSQTHLGFERNKDTYLSGVINDPSVQKLPVGAGAFMATDVTNTKHFSYGPGTVLQPSEFFNANVIYFKKNPNFETVGGPTATAVPNRVTNVQFDYLRYQVIDNTKTMDAVIQGTIHFADPNAEPKNVQRANAYTDRLAVSLIDNLGYGYIGINASRVPDIEVRRAIMSLLNKKFIFDFYTDNLAEPLHRPMSKVIEWCYPTNATDRYPYNESTQNAMLSAIEANYTLKNGIYERVNPISQSVDKLEFTFTVAGSETNHPAYTMFIEAANILNDRTGWKVNVQPDAQALIKLTNGQLDVWAAAWGAAIDPDMYQVYHRDSTATSVKAWGYPYLLQFGTNAEKTILNNLADRIEAGRSSVDLEVRKSVYNVAMNYVMDLAVEYPTYQRKNLFVYNKNKLVQDSLNQNPTAYTGLLDRIWEVKLRY